MDNKFIGKIFKAVPAQSRTFFILLISILIPVLCAGGYLYLFIFKTLSAIPAQPYSAPVDVYPLMMKTNLVITLGFVPLFLLLITWGVMISRRITESTTKLQKEIDKVAEQVMFQCLNAKSCGDEPAKDSPKQQ